MLKSKYSFDKNVSSQLKAFALVLMIMHHLWHRPYFALFEPIEYGHLLLSIGMMGKICVGMFLFVSGYGLMASYCSAGNVFHIWGRRVWCRLLLVAALLVARFVLGWNILNIGLIIAMIMFLIDIQGYLSDKVKRGFDFLGKMSMNMWLIHLFFIVYGFHFRNPFADLTWIYLESLAAAYIIWCVYHKQCGCKW